MKYAKRLLTVLLALSLVFVMAAPSFAIVTANLPTSGGNSYYVQTNNSDYYVDGEFWVQLHITTGKEGTAGPIDYVYDVEMGSENAVNQLYTVEDVLIAAHQQYSTLSFTTQTFYSPQSGTYDSLVTGVMDTAVNPICSFDSKILYKDPDPNPDPLPLYSCGYVFRINGMIPYYIPTGSTVPCGCTISSAYVTADDSVDLYFIDIFATNPASKVRAISYISSTYNSITKRYTATFQLLEAEFYFDGLLGYDWTLSSWAPVTSASVSIRVDGSVVTTSTNASGYFTVSGLKKGLRSFRYNTNWDNTYYFYDQNNNQVTFEMPSVVGIHFEHRFN